MIKSVDSRISKDFKILDARITDNVNVFNNQLNHKLEKLKVFTTERNTELKGVVQQQIEAVKSCALDKDLGLLKEKVDNLKTQMEDENAGMYTIVREQRDKASELSKRFTMTVEKLQQTGFAPS